MVRTLATLAPEAIPALLTISTNWPSVSWNCSRLDAGRMMADRSAPVTCTPNTPATQQPRRGSRHRQQGLKDQASPPGCRMANVRGQQARELKAHTNDVELISSNDGKSALGSMICFTPALPQRTSRFLDSSLPAVRAPMHAAPWGPSHLRDAQELAACVAAEVKEELLLLRSHHPRRIEAPVRRGVPRLHRSRGRAGRGSGGSRGGGHKRGGHVLHGGHSQRGGDNKAQKSHEAGHMGGGSCQERDTPQEHRMQLLAKNMAHEEGAGKAEGPQGGKAEALGARRELGVACRQQTGAGRPAAREACASNPVRWSSGEVRLGGRGPHIVLMGAAVGGTGAAGPPPSWMCCCSTIAGSAAQVQSRAVSPSRAS